MGILLGLLTAVSWGSSDFLARFATHRIGTLRTMLYMQFTGFLLLSIALPWLGGWGHLADGSGWRPWACGALAGVLNFLASTTLYRSFEIGKLSVVAPISASYPVLTVFLSLLSGEHLRTARAVGIVFTLLGVVFVAAGEKVPHADDEDGLRRSGKGIGLALCSAIGFGFLFWLLGTRIVPITGATQTVWLIRLTSSILAALLILAVRKPMKPPTDRVAGWLLAMGLTDTGAFVLNNFGMRIEQVAVVSVLASLYGAVTVALAAIVLREHVSRWQWLGIISIFAGIFLISR
ncbi:MAG TPA: DMT family transporter [Candidatus Acidoferrum sp.]